MRATNLLASLLIFSVGGVAAGQTETPAQLSTQSSASGVGQTAEVTVVGCLRGNSRELWLTGEDGKGYDLIGHTEELRKHMGDKLEVTGTEEAPRTPDHLAKSTLKVRSVRTIFHKNPAGVQPSLGDITNWRSYIDKTYGVVLRYPETLKPLDQPRPKGGPDFVDRTGVVTLKGFGVSPRVYPEANFGGGSLTIFVNPMIRNEGTCRQFGWSPRTTPTLTAGGITYPGVWRTGLAAGHASDQYHFHTYQNGFCYEFAFEFEWNPGTGMEPTFLCSIQQVLEQNRLELVKALLSEVQFVTPEVRNAAREKSQRSSPPTVSSFEYTQDTKFPECVTVSWSTEGADYVQLRYPCAEKLFVSELGGMRQNPWPPGAHMKCGDLVVQNFLPNGSAKLVVSNFNPSLVAVLLSIVPFSDGVSYPKRSKTITIPVSPHR